MQTNLRKYLLLLIASFAMITVLSCGDSDNPEEPDVEPPSLASVFPADGAVDVSTGTNISATFSEPMNITSFSASSFAISPTIAGVFSTAGNVVTFDPDNALSYITDYQITMSTELKDVAGNQLDTSFSWTFTTAPNTNTGITWDQFVMTGNTVPMNGVAGNGSVVVAVGDSGRIFYANTPLSSTSSWTRFAITDTVHSLNDIAWSGKQFVAVGDVGVIYVSATGTSFWTPATSNTSRNLNAIAWYTDQFVAVGDSAAITTSPDGVSSWSVKETIGLDSLYNLLDIGVMSDPKNFVIVGKYSDVGTIFYRGPIMTVAITSLDFVTFSGGNFFTNVARAMDQTNLWVAVGNDQFGAGVSMWSSSGATWAQERKFSSETVTDIAWSRNLFATAGDNGNVWTTDDGINWTDRSSANGTSSNLRAITWSGDQLIAVGEDGVVLVSPAAAGTP
ncbi:MAG: Ig-like domain-containing protein [bacterium]|nr:Ig-like domain-containing protein [bacterium]